MTATLRIAILGTVLLALGAFLSVAQGQGSVTFGIRPAGPDGSPDGSYFSYVLEPGAVIMDRLVAINDGQGPVTLKLYAADGLTAINGGTAFSNQDEERSGTRSWLWTGVSELEVAPGQEVVIPFTLNVPSDATPGDHVAGWVAEAPPKSGSSQGLGVAVVERVGMAVVIQIPGPASENLTLGAICLNQESGSNYFQLPVSNEGSALTKGSGTLTLTDDAGFEVFAHPVKLGTVLPADSTFLRVDAPFDPGPGDYVAELTLRQSDGQEAVATSSIDISDKKVNGCKSAVAGQNQPPDDDRPSGFVDAVTPGGPFPWLVALVVALVLILLVIIGVRERSWRRRIPPPTR